jgi:hypothetical protein
LAESFRSGSWKTPSDFGVRADPPTQSELLDYMAAWFMDNGWSLKSSTNDHAFEHLSAEAAMNVPISPQKMRRNTLLWRMNRRRSNFEPFRDTLLAVADKLDLKEGGHPVRSQPTLRSAPHHLRLLSSARISRVFSATFDFASPDTTSPQRVQYHRAATSALHDQFRPSSFSRRRSFVKRPEVTQARGPAPQKVTALYEAALTTQNRQRRR